MPLSLILSEVRGLNSACGSFEAQATQVGAELVVYPNETQSPWSLSHLESSIHA